MIWPGVITKNVNNDSITIPIQNFRIQAPDDFEDGHNSLPFRVDIHTDCFDRRERQDPHWKVGPSQEEWEIIVKDLHDRYSDLLDDNESDCDEHDDEIRDLNNLVNSLQDEKKEIVARAVKAENRADDRFVQLTEALKAADAWGVERATLNERIRMLELIINDKDEDLLYWRDHRCKP